MKLNKGCVPYYKKDPKKLSFHRTFGSVSQFVQTLNLDKYLNDDNQGDTPYCTAYSVADICTNQDGVNYSPDYQIAKTVELMYANPTTFVGASLPTALSVPTIFGLLLETQTNITWQSDGELYAQNPENYPSSLDQLAIQNKRQQDFIIEQNEDLDWFDSIRSAITTNNSPIAIATPWYAEYEECPSTGILPTGITQTSWHSTEIVGWTVIGEDTYLICKSHQGTNYGNNGYCYFSREEFNRIMDILGSCGGVIVKNFTAQTVPVQISTYEKIVGNIYQFLYEILAY